MGTEVDTPTEVMGTEVFRICFGVGGTEAYGCPTIVLCEKILYSIFTPLRDAFRRNLETQRLSITRIDAIDAKFFIYNLRSISQAGRRGFDSRLPLQSKSLLIKYLSQVSQGVVKRQIGPGCG